MALSHFASSLHAGVLGLASDPRHMFHEGLQPLAQKQVEGLGATRHAETLGVADAIGEAVAILAQQVLRTLHGQADAKF